MAPIGFHAEVSVQNPGTLLADKEYYEPLSRLEPAEEYVRVLRRSLPPHWEFTRSDIWLGCHADGLVVPPQGFKIHVSATLLTAEETLSRVAPICAAAGASFKCAASPQFLRLLTSKRYARGGGSKFITVYPPDHATFLELVRALDDATRDLEGPYILSDKRLPGSRVVFYRYGGFRRMARLNVDGTKTPMMVTPDGRAIEDPRPPVFTLPPWVTDPFPQEGEDAADEGPVRLNGRFEIQRAVGFTNSGGIYMATDVTTGADVIVKEARPLTNFWTTGSGWLDAPALLRHEYEILRRLEGTCVVRPVDFFSEWEHSYLVETVARGEPLYRIRARDNNSIAIHLHRDSANVRQWLARYRQLALNLLAAIGDVHARGIILGDISPNNIFADPNDMSVEFIDVESAIAVDDTSFAAEFSSVWATPGFRSPHRTETKSIRAEDDLYAIGMILLSLILPVEPLTEIDPAARDRFLNLFESLGVPAAIRTAITALIAGNAATAESVLRDLDPESVDLSGLNRPTGCGVPRAEAVSTARRIASFILSTGDCRRADRLWPANPTVFETNSMSVAHGACGTALFLQQELGEVPDDVRAWLLAQPLSPETHPPGLYTGLAGIAYTFAALGEIERARSTMLLAHRSPLLRDDPSIFQGAAGVGLADLYLYSQTRDREFLDHAVTLAERLVQGSTDEGGRLSWPKADAAPTPLGFAYGASGIALFLLYVALRTSRDDLMAAAKAALEFDIGFGTWRDGRLVWGEDSRDISNRPYWLQGTSGVGAALVRFHSLLGDARYGELAADAARGSYSLMCVVPTLFEGLSGIGELQLDLYLATGDTAFRDAAERLVRTVRAYAIDRPDGLAFPGRSLNRIATDLGWGSAGVGMFLSRLASPGPRLLHDVPWAPLRTAAPTSGAGLSERGVAVAL